MIATSAAATEKAFATLGVEQNIRNDGRDRMDYRDLAVDNGVLPQAHGSARVTVGRDLVGGGGTDVLAAVKAELATPAQEAPGQGFVVVSVDCAPSLFIHANNRRDAREDVNAELSAAMGRLLSSSLALESLCVMHGRFAWRLFIDVMVFSTAGNVLDVVSMAVWSALSTTRLPKLVPIQAEAGFPDDFELDSNQENAQPLDIEQVPISVTLNIIGTEHVVDAAPLEEACAATRVSVGVNRRGDFCGVYQAGSSALPATRIPELMGCALGAASTLFEGLEAAAKRSTKQAGEHPDLLPMAAGFFA